MSRASGAIRFSFIVSVLLLMLSVAVRIIVSDSGFIYRLLMLNNVGTVTGFAPVALERLAAQLSGYLTGPRGPIHLYVQVAANQVVPMFDARQTAHLQDVQRIVQVVLWLGWLVLPFLVLRGFLAYHEHSWRSLGIELVLASVLMLVLLIALSVSAIKGFDRFWVACHRVLFPQGNWSFDPARDLLVMLFTPAFWIQESIRFVGILGMLASLTGIAGMMLAAAFHQPRQR